MIAGLLLGAPAVVLSLALQVFFRGCKDTRTPVVCLVWKERQDNWVPYQELEMALPESASATNVEGAEGWDQDWDDNWDEEVAVKSPVRTHGM